MTSKPEEVVTSSSPSPSSAQQDGPRGERRSRLSSRGTVLLCLLAILAAGGRLALLSPTYQEWRLSRMPLPELLRSVQAGRNNSLVLYYAGLRLTEQGRYADADPLLERAVGLDPDTPRLRDAWARALLGSGMPTAAHGELYDFVMRHPEMAAAHDMLGKFYFIQKSMERAEAEFERAVAINPRDLQAWEYLSQAADVQLKTTQAQQAAEHAVALRPNDARDHLLLASVLRHSSQFVAARSEYARVVALDPHIAVAHRDYALTLLASFAEPDDWRLAADQARQAVALDPADASGWLALGRALMYGERPKEAVDPLLRAASLEGMDTAPALALTQVYQRLGQTSEHDRWRREYLRRQHDAAEQRTLQMAVSVRPADRAAQMNLARWLGRHGQAEEAAHHYATALHRPLDSAPVLAATARDLTAGGHPEQALPLARRAATVGYKNAVAHLALGETLFALGKETEGLDEYQTALNIEPALKTELVRRLRQRMAERRVQANGAKLAHH
jgi:tetratricopeptide (TPR) repeat protein